MDSKTVNAELRRTVRPLLKQNGFSVFTSRTGWRFVENRIEVVNFQSFNAYQAEVIGCTTYSFAVNLGTYLTEIPAQHGEQLLKKKNGVILPQEYQCHFRCKL